MKEIVSIEDQLKAMAQKATATERPSTSSISFRAGQMSLNKQPVPNNSLDTIIVGSTYANYYYEGAYDPDNIANPTCYAYSQDGTDMAPHPESASPQHETCHGCPQNEWGSKGKGKACKNQRVLALVPADTKEVATAEVATLKLPVTSVVNWSNYVNKIATLFSRPPLGMITTISTVPDPKSQFKVVFNQVAPVETEMLGALMEKSETLTPLLERVYEATEQREETKGKKKF